MSDDKTKPAPEAEEARRAALKKLGKYAAYSAPVVTMLLATRSAEAGS